LRFESDDEHAPWQVTMVDTGLETGRAARLLQLAPYLGNGRFFVAYGEAVANINLQELVNFHTAHGKTATITGIRIASQYGKIEADENGRVTQFQEKPELPYWVNGGFMLFEPSFLHLIRQKHHPQLMETDLMPQLMAAQNLMLYPHTGYWQSMKTLKDALKLKEDWQQRQPWKVW
jgi:glucose-1-phosphate cytidylyltransferase